MAKSKYIEALEEQYTKKDAKSVLRYKAPDNKWRYVQTSKDASGGNMPSGGGMTEVTWQELKDKRDNGELNPGSLYRITDYNCTTTQENTQSAGHQFDIVLLALSEDKLAEEGWAMMHDTPIYDVTFSDGVTKKCYIGNLRTIDEGYAIKDYVDIVYADTLLGYPMIPTEALIINEETKTASFVEEYPFPSTEESYDDVTYNYFQNSNLSAWKVWYCLDNDKSRFAWADDSVDEGSPAYIIDSASNLSYIRNLAGDEQNYFAWKYEDTNIYTETSTPNVGDTVYYYDHGLIEPSPATVSSYTPPTQGTGLPNGRGVIYRLIDEWNNDVGYDFKNIQFKRPMTDGKYDPDNGEPTLVYTFTDTEEGEITDATAKSVEFFTNSFIERYCWAHKLSNNVVLTIGNGSNWIHVEAESKNNTFYNDPTNIRLVHSQNMEIDGENDTIYINNKKVLTES